MHTLPSIIPAPSKILHWGGFRLLHPETGIIASPAFEDIAALLKSTLSTATSWPFDIDLVESEGAAATASLTCHRICLIQDPAIPDEEGYRLEVDWTEIRIRASNPAGAYYAVQTLLQLLPPAVYQGIPRAEILWPLPLVHIEDAPRFRWRGVMLDSSRYFQPVPFIKKFIRLMAAHKFNVFHWHLTDDQGWRIEIKKYPKLTEVGAWRSESPRGHIEHVAGGDGIPHGGFYTKEDVREIVAFASKHHVSIVPEIEMPGHAQAAIAAYPELGCTGGNPGVSTIWGIHENIFNPQNSTIRFLQDVLDEVMEMFPGTYVHIGGDEARKTQWEATPAIQTCIRELGVRDSDALQSWFISQMAVYLTDHGRKLVGWDEILEGGLPLGATVMSWRGTEGGIAAARAGHDVVMTPNDFTYLNYYQSLDTTSEPLALHKYLPLETVYAYEPVPPEIAPEFHSRVIGVQGQVWTEYIPTPEQIEYMAFPRACALAEVAWSPAASRNVGDFRKRLARHLKRLDLIGVKYRPPDCPV